VGEEARGITPIIGVIVEIGSQVGPTEVQLSRCRLQSIENNTNTYMNIETQVDGRTLCPPLLSFIQETQRHVRDLRYTDNQIYKDDVQDRADFQIFKQETLRMASHARQNKIKIKS